LLDAEHEELIRVLRKCYGPYRCEDSGKLRHRWTLIPEYGWLETSFDILKDAHRSMRLKGPFNPDGYGPCVALAIEDGAWAVRSSKGEWTVLNREPDTADSYLLRAIRPLGPNTAAGILARSPESPTLAVALEGMTSHDLGVCLRRIKRQGPTRGMTLKSKSGRGGTLTWWVETGEHPDAPLLRAWKAIGPMTVAEALGRPEVTGLVRESSAQALGVRLRGIRQQGPIDGMVLKSKSGRWQVE
jgi:hypothetical protein